MKREFQTRQRVSPDEFGNSGRFCRKEGKEKNIYQHKGPSQPQTLQSPGVELLETVLTLAVTHLLQRRLVPQRVLARLDDEGETGGDRLGRLCRLGLLGGGHR